MTSLPNESVSGERADIAFFDPRHYEGFDSSIAQELAKLLQKAYEQFDLFAADEKAKKPLEQRSKLQLSEEYQLKSELYENNIPFGFVASKASSKDIFVVLRGTKTFAEWFKDANIPLVSYSDGRSLDESILRAVGQSLQLTRPPVVIPNVSGFGRVTVGFRQIYTALRQAIIDVLNLCNKNTRVFVTGHSLGGALATLAVPDILSNTHFNTPEKVTLYTFASPRCGDREFAIEFRDTGVRHWRIANTEDFVTMIPFPTGNVFQAALPETPPELDVSPKYPYVGLGNGGVTGPDRNPNPFFGFIKAMYDRNKRRMPDYVHTGTPIYFTIHLAALERHHNLEEIYMRGILQFKDF